MRQLTWQETANRLFEIWLEEHRSLPFDKKNTLFFETMEKLIGSAKEGLWIRLYYWLKRNYTISMPLDRFLEAMEKLTKEQAGKLKKLSSTSSVCCKVFNPHRIGKTVINGEKRAEVGCRCRS